ncbi:MAG: globin [Tepidiforma sp.]|nr:globin [Tepidiforma sp.]GIW18559.1 MAG: globin [Tepidiforma sp.]
MNPSETSAAAPYHQVGGAETVARIVEAFYARVEADDVLRPLYPEDLEPGKKKLAWFFEQWLGGPPSYSERYGHPRLRRRHFPFVIDERAAGRWLRLMREAWTEAGVPRAIQDPIFERLTVLARHMINANDDVPREPLGDVYLD